MYYIYMRDGLWFDSLVECGLLLIILPKHSNTIEGT